MAELNYRDEGTLAHALAEMALREGQPCAAYVGRILTVEPSKHFTLGPSSAVRWIRCPGSVALAAAMPAEGAEKPVVGEITEEMADDVQIYVDWVNAQSGEKFFEQDLPIEQITGEPGATGRTDVVIIDGDLCTVVDLKFGRGIQVDAEKNPQLAMYALGALETFGVVEDLQRFRFVIHQPRVSKEPSIWDCTLEKLEKFRAKAALAAKNVHIATEYAANWIGKSTSYLTPGDEQCKWCRAKNPEVCQALSQVPQSTLEVDFADLTAEEKITEATATVAKSPHLARFYAIVPLIEQWIDAVNAAMHASVAAGEQSDYKIVAGRKGARAWKDKAQAEALMKSMRLKHDEMYDYAIISPTSAEKVLADSPKRWNKLLPLIGQGEGKPTIAKATDKRPALTVHFEDLAGAEDLV